MICRKTEIIAKEGWPYILFFIALSIGFAFLKCAFISTLFLVLSVIFGYIFRNTERIPYEFDDLSLLSPMDGKVDYIGKVLEKKYNQKEMFMVSVKSNIFDLSIYRNPVDLDIKDIIYTHGIFLDKDSKQANYLNEKIDIVSKYNNKDILITVVAGKFSKKIYTFCDNYKKVRKGDRFLLVTDAIVKIYLPLEFRSNVVEGEQVRSGESVLGYFI